MGVSGNLWIVVKDVKTLVVYELPISSSIFRAIKHSALEVIFQHISSTSAWLNEKKKKKRFNPWIIRRSGLGHVL